MILTEIRADEERGVTSSDMSLRLIATNIRKSLREGDNPYDLLPEWQDDLSEVAKASDIGDAENAFDVSRGEVPWPIYFDEAARLSFASFPDNRASGVALLVNSDTSLVRGVYSQGVINNRQLRNQLLFEIILASVVGHDQKKGVGLSAYRKLLTPVGGAWSVGVNLAGSNGDTLYDSSSVVGATIAGRMVASSSGRKL